jgi:hypothetical protein
MSRRAELSPSAGARRRCTAGYHGYSCKKRTCEICGLTWAKDWRVVLFANLKELNSLVMFSAITPPGQDHLPYDEKHCAHVGPHVHGKRHGAASIQTHSPSGRMTSRSGGSGCTTQRGTR